MCTRFICEYQNIARISNLFFVVGKLSRSVKRLVGSVGFVRDMFFSAQFSHISLGILTL